ncbi:monovalent cation/H(+) antiporter subunit G [Streptacidiphilus sp. P02-A3a]|uniref:cation:proton antiporter n=1 Tax=Streptacidiphilus sp. P02-A3a TaxID=2704468 RepID=UPI0015FBD6D6|nr:monovalent cation/H(+) antiporter subunit G [Streptacidiphilus sp. P02-A3a]QMU69331.1 monovalent cation/H(+) antiporter subunit G [Streptacidiphilus sp. P02-A3a]
MGIRHLIALVLLVTGTGVLLLSACALLALPGPYARLHALAPATSLGAPLIALALAVDTGPGRAAVKLLFVGALLALAGPITTMAIARVVAATDPEAAPVGEECN